ncbi:MAG: type II secretion system protein [Candidatus Vogelbacteria bacterium]
MKLFFLKANEVPTLRSGPRPQQGVGATRGFTLIELLVVIAIIGLLSSIVLASLSTARAKAADAAIQSNLVGVRSSAELQYSTAGCYTNTDSCSTVPLTTGSCSTAITNGTNIFGQTNIAAQIVAAQLAGGNYASCYATAGGTKWAVAVVFKTDNKKAWCVDSAGTSKQIDSTSGFTTQARLNFGINLGVCTPVTVP